MTQKELIVLIWEETSLSSLAKANEMVIEKEENANEYYKKQLEEIRDKIKQRMRALLDNDLLWKQNMKS